jgi:hypothetical protein
MENQVDIHIFFLFSLSLSFFEGLGLPVGDGSRLTVVNCCCPPDWGSSHWKAKMGWLTGANWTQKNASFKSKHEKQVVSAGIRASKVYGLGTIRCRVTTV